MQTLQLAWEDIYSSSLKFLYPLTPQQTYKTVVSESKRLLDADEGTIILHKKRNLVRAYASFNKIKKYEVSPRGRTYKAFKTREPFYVYVKSAEDMHPGLYEMGFKTIFFIPISYGLKAKGVLNILYKKRVKVTPKETIKLRFFGAMISQALYKTEQFEKTEEAIIARDLFIAMASHELKNPLTSIIMTTELIKRACENKKIPEERLVNSLLTQSLWLSKLVNEILETRNIRRGKLNPINDIILLIDVIELALTTFNASHRDYKVILVSKILKEDSQIKGDFYKLLQVYINILNNAAKFSSNKYPIVVTVTKTNTDIETKIIDQGIGIAQKELSKIFEGFYQGGKRTHDGMWLGLYLVKQIIDSSGGQITITSKSNKGTIVTVSFPRYAKS